MPETTGYAGVNSKGIAENATIGKRKCVCFRWYASGRLACGYAKQNHHTGEPVLNLFQYPGRALVRGETRNPVCLHSAHSGFPPLPQGHFVTTFERAEMTVFPTIWVYVSAIRLRYLILGL